MDCVPGTGCLAQRRLFKMPLEQGTSSLVSLPGRTGSGLSTKAKEKEREGSEGGAWKSGTEG